MVFSCLRGASCNRPLSFLLGFEPCLVLLSDLPVLSRFSLLCRLVSLESESEPEGEEGGLIEDELSAMATEKIVEKARKRVKKVHFQ